MLNVGEAESVQTGTEQLTVLQNCGVLRGYLSTPFASAIECTGGHTTLETPKYTMI